MTKPYDETVLYPNDLLVEYANHLLNESGSQLEAKAVQFRGERHVQFEAVNSRGRKVDLVMPTGNPKTGMLFARSLLKVRPGARTVSWLINGQHSTGTTQIAFFGESGPWLTVPLDNVRAYFGTAREHIRDEVKANFDAMVEERLHEAATEGHISEIAEIHTWDDGHTHVPLRGPTAPPAP